MSTVPIISPAGRVVMRLEVELAEQITCARFIRTRRGRLVRVEQTTADMVVCDGGHGQGFHFEQRLPESGRVVHALRGVAGSEPEPKPMYCRRCDDVHRGPCPRLDEEE